MSIFEPIADVLNYIGSVFQLVYDAIEGTISIINSIFDLIISITRIIPYPMYPCLMAFLGIYFTIFTYKIIRKG